jgi:5-methyltetrahydropteroyltriglutamate--homocysteine methyltransferase
MSRDKLKRLGIELPLLPTTSVGSFPKPGELKRGRARRAKGEISREELAQIERAATDFWIDKQIELGIDVLVDGEMYRGDMVAYFAEILGGFEIGGLVRSYGNRFYHKPIIVGDVQWPGPITVEWWRYAQSKTDRPVKGMLTGPYTVMDWSFNEHYADRRAAAMALAEAIRSEVAALIDAGCRIIQIDEPAVSVRPAEMDIVIEAMHHAVDGQEAYFITHICYGDFPAIYPKMLEIPVDNFDLELANRHVEMLDLFRRAPFTKDLSAGVNDVHYHETDPPEVLAERIRAVLDVLPAERVWVDPDCGLKTRTVDEGIAFLDAVSKAAALVRAGLA